MKTRILFLGFPIAVAFFSGGVIAQQTMEDSPSVKKDSSSHMAIPWYYPPVYDTDVNVNLINGLSGYNPKPKDASCNYSMRMEEVISYTENQPQKYNNPVKYGIDEYVALKPKRY